MTYEEMKEEEIEECARLVAKAFRDYDYFSMHIPNERRRMNFLLQLLTCEFKANLGIKGVKFYVAKEDGKIVALGQLCEPGFKRPSDATYIRIGWPKVMLKGGMIAVTLWHHMELKATEPCHALEGNTWYMSLLTVKTTEEGRGIGSHFINDFLIPKVIEGGARAVSLFTNSEENCKFYEKNGFEIFDEREFSYKDKSVKSWSYIRRLEL